MITQEAIYLADYWAPYLRGVGTYLQVAASKSQLSPNAKKVSSFRIIFEKNV